MPLEEAEAGMAEMSERFRDEGGELYVPVEKPNPEGAAQLETRGLDVDFAAHEPDGPLVQIIDRQFPRFLAGAARGDARGVRRARNFGLAIWRTRWG